MDVQEILRRHCGRGYLYEICFVHGQDVAGMAVELAEKLSEEVDLEFLREAAILHDIGIVQTFRPGLGCSGSGQRKQRSQIGYSESIDSHMLQSV